LEMIQCGDLEIGLKTNNILQKRKYAKTTRC
jgi:hypothetical protein